MHADGFHLTVQSRGRRFVSGITIKLEDSFQFYVVVGSSLSGRAFGRSCFSFVCKKKSFFLTQLQFHWLLKRGKPDNEPSLLSYSYSLSSVHERS